MKKRDTESKQGFLRRISGLTLLDKIKSADICEYLNIEPLLLRPERSQLRWYGHVTVTRMSQERTAKKLLCFSVSSCLSSSHEKATEALCIGRVVRFHQAEITIVKHLIQRRNNEAWVEVKPLILGSWPL